MKESGKKKSIEDLIEKNPEIVTQLLKTWIEEE
jgi:flagellar M-ring protein fliF